MNDLNVLMQERLDKWRKNPRPVSSAEKIRGPQGIYIPRRDSGDEYEEEASMQEQRNRSNNGKLRSR